MFKVGDKVVYLNSVCEIKDIKEKFFKDQDYYVLVPVENESLTVNVPIDSKVIRNLISKKEIEVLIGKIESIEPLENKRLERVYMNLYNSGKHEDLLQ
jgi:RNA polymerase-interacting CarD/CdnL/TRCF family regulator